MKYLESNFSVYPQTHKHTNTPTKPCMEAGTLPKNITPQHASATTKLIVEIAELKNKPIDTIKT